MSVREIRELIIEVLIVSLFLSPLTLLALWDDLFANESIEVKLKEAILLQLGVMLILGPVFYAFCKQRKESTELNRVVDEGNNRKAEAEERSRIYEENYQALKKRVLDDLKAIARGEKARFDPETLDAAKALQMRQGEHPETVAAWTPLINDLNAEIVNPKAIHWRLNELPYPDTLEDVDALKKLMADGLEKLARGEISRPDPEAVDAAKALNEITARDTRIRREEEERNHLL